MAFVRKANVLLEVPDDSVERMIDDGFDVVDSHGNIISKSIPHDAITLRKLYIQSLDEIKALKEKIASLEANQAEHVVTETIKEETVAKTRRSKKD